MTLANGKPSKVIAALKYLAMIVVVLFITSDPFKVRDPNDPAFAPHRFRFTDYHREDVPGVFEKLLRPGTDEAHVDNILMASAGAEANWSHGIKIYSFRWPLFYLWRGIPTLAYLFNIESDMVMILYDADHKLIAARANNGWIGVNREMVDKIADAEADRGLSSETLRLIHERKHYLEEKR